jgi:hypothetical protein
MGELVRQFARASALAAEAEAVQPDNYQIKQLRMLYSMLARRAPGFKKFRWRERQT